MRLYQHPLGLRILRYAIARVEAGDTDQAAALLEHVARCGREGKPLPEPLAEWLERSAKRCTTTKKNPLAPGAPGVSPARYDQKVRLEFQVLGLLAPMIEAGVSVEAAARRISPIVGIGEEQIVRIRRAAIKAQKPAKKQDIK